MVSDPVLFWGSVVLGTVLGPVILAVWVRNHERHAPEPWSSVGRAFAWGATGAILVSVVAEMLLAPSELLRPVGVPSALVAAVIVAPVVEEAGKGIGLRWIGDAHVEVEDGLVYGAAIGLGFAATENVVYGVSAWVDGGLAGLVATVALRTLTSSLLHATASAVLGYAVWKRRAGQAGTLAVLLAYGGAVVLHSVFNFAAASRLILSFLAVLAIAVGGFSWLRGRVRELDRRA